MDEKIENKPIDDCGHSDYIKALLEEIKALKDEIYWCDKKCYALERFAPPIKCVCPHCNDGFIFDGYVCTNCGYDFNSKKCARK